MPSSRGIVHPLVIKMCRSWIRRRGGGKTAEAKLFGAAPDSTKMSIEAALSGLMTSVTLAIQGK